MKKQIILYYLNIFVSTFIFVIFFFGCKEPEYESRRTLYSDISESQKALQDKFELIINDLDDYSSDGSSIDTMKIVILISGENDSMDLVAFPRIGREEINLKLNDLAILSNGGISLVSIDGENRDEIFFKNLDAHPEEYPYLELVDDNNGSAAIYHGTIVSLDTEDKKISIAIKSGLLDERLEIHIKE